MKSRAHSKGLEHASWRCTGRSRGFEPNAAQFRAQTWSTTLLMLLIIAWALKIWSPLITGHHGNPVIGIRGQRGSGFPWYYCSQLDGFVRRGLLPKLSLNNEVSLFCLAMHIFTLICNSTKINSFSLQLSLILLRGKKEKHFQWVCDKKLRNRVKICVKDPARVWCE